jgi:beta-galactosidase
MMKIRINFLSSLLIMSLPLFAQTPGRHEFSTAGFFQIQNSGREVYNFNVGWRFNKGPAEKAEQPDFDDSGWEIVNTPHGLEYLPDEASGGINYQGEAWYRKHFTVPDNVMEKKIFICFEALMGKSKIWLNGKLLKENYGGYLPVIIDITGEVKFNGGKNILTVLVDNSDDPSYPPGKPQRELDFTYFGGIYRDVWLYSTNPVHITDPNLSDKVAGGGVFVHYENVSEQQVDVVVSTEVINETDRSERVIVTSTVMDADEVKTGTVKNTVTLKAKSSSAVTQRIILKNPHLWQPDDPYLHALVSEITGSNNITDGIKTKIGIRKIEFKGQDGFFLNNKPFEDKLMGANRHQDFAYIGNAMTNSLHWRDVKKLRNAGMCIIRSAHYPQDPAFMDACDELGMFIIVATPGWQFWNKEPVFEQRVYSDIRNMVRRDRNHPSVIMWEPILNETGYPDTFAQNVHKITHEEYPFQGCFTACDRRARGSDNFDIKYNFASDNTTNTYFVREWGDNVDDWSSHNSNSRGRRSWGENVQIIQALHYLRPEGQPAISIDRFYSLPRQVTGGALWHSFDHNRGYHPDPFYGGLMDVFRQPKYSYYGFQSMRDPDANIPNIENGPMVFIANEMTPFSNGDVWVFSNCEELKLTVSGKEPQTIKVKDLGANMPHPPVKFEKVFTWADIQRMGRSQNKDAGKITVEGLIGGKVAATAVKSPAKRETRLVLEVDLDGTPLLADGSDIVTVIASLVDQNRNVKRLGEEEVVFEVSGEGRMIAENESWANPRKIEWGTAPCLVQSTTTAGKITVNAHTLFEGINIALPATITFESVPSPHPFLFYENGSLFVSESSGKKEGINNEQIELLNNKIRQLESELNKIKLKEVEKQQSSFEIKLP